jgi:SAM-dependent methyltransferase
MALTDHSDSETETTPPRQRAGEPTAPGETTRKSAGDIADIYGEVADTLHRWSWVDRLVTGRYRERQFGDVRGHVLDVACGTGTNFPYLHPSVDLHGIDVSPDMVANARQELETLELDGSVEEMDAQDLAFPADSFDVVISALSTCTFPDPGVALREMSRVCKPDGEIRLLEHGRSGVGPVDWVLDHRAEAHYREKGCRWNQEPVAVVEDAGLRVVRTEQFFAGLVTAIDARPATE